MKKTTGCWKKKDFFDTTKKWTLVEFFKSVGLNSTCYGVCSCPDSHLLFSFRIYIGSIFSIDKVSGSPGLYRSAGCRRHTAFHKDHGT